MQRAARHGQFPMHINMRFAKEFLLQYCSIRVIQVV